MHIVGPALGLALALANMLGKSLVPGDGTEAAETTNAAVPAQRDGASGADPAALATENAALKTELARTKAELAALRTQATPKPALADQAAAGCPTDPTPPTAADFAASADNLRRIEAEGAEALSRLTATTAAAFYREQVESPWAADSAAAIYEAWQKNQTAGATLLDLQCRATLCRIEIEYTQRAAAGDIEGRLLDALSLLFNGSQRQTEPAPDGGDYERAVLYLARRA